MDFDYNIDSSFSFSWDELLAAIDNNYYVAIRIEDSEGYYRDYIFNRDMRSDNEIIFVHIDQQGIYQLSIYNDATVNGGSRTLKTDTTLSLIQHPADAKAVGDALATKAPVYTYGTNDLVAGESELASGTLYFVYEEEE